MTLLAIACFLATPHASADLLDVKTPSDAVVEVEGDGVTVRLPIHVPQPIEGTGPEGVSIGITCIWTDAGADCIVCFGTDSESSSDYAKVYLGDGGWGVGIPQDKVNGGAPYDAFKADPGAKAEC